MTDATVTAAALGHDPERCAVRFSEKIMLKQARSAAARRRDAVTQALLIHTGSGVCRCAGLAEAPEQPRHQAKPFARDRRQEMLVRRVLRAAGVRMRDPDGLELEHVDENVVRQRAAEIGQDDWRMAGGALERG